MALVELLAQEAAKSATPAASRVRLDEVARLFKGPAMVRLWRTARIKPAEGEPRLPTCRARPWCRGAARSVPGTNLEKPFSRNLSRIVLIPEVPEATMLAGSMPGFLICKNERNRSGISPSV